ncbi:cell division protein FtsX [Patescibacteria group bacterium]
MFISIYRVIKFALQNFIRNFWLSFVTIIILSLTFITITFLIIFNVITRESINAIQNKIDISVYFKQEVTEEEVYQKEFQLLALPWTKNIKYISKEQALENFKIKHFDNPDLLSSLEQLDENPLGATLIITAKDVNNYTDIISVLNSDNFKDIIQNKNFNDYKKAVDQTTMITYKVKKVGIIASIIFAMVALLILFYTIKIAIYTHKDEIGIMKLVGAGNFFIKAPFLIETIFYSITACLLSILVIYPLLKFLNPHISAFFAGTEFDLLNYFRTHIFSLMGWQLVGAIMLNLVSSTVALSKYLKV